jgi:DNA-binding MarR family transcriptional regulator
MHPSSADLPDPPPVPPTAEDALMSLMMAFGRRLRQRQPGDAVDYSAFPLLKLLTHQGPMRLSTMALALGLDASTVSRHARQLEDRGLLERTEDPDDRRASRLAVSPHGEDCLAQGFETRRRLIGTALEGWPEEEREALRLLLHKLVESLVAPPEDPDGSASATPTDPAPTTARPLETSR